MSYNESSTGYYINIIQNYDAAESNNIDIFKQFLKEFDESVKNGEHLCVQQLIDKIHDDDLRIMHILTRFQDYARCKGYFLTYYINTHGFLYANIRKLEIDSLSQEYNCNDDYQWTMKEEEYSDNSRGNFSDKVLNYIGDFKEKTDNMGIKFPTYKVDNNAKDYFAISEDLFGHYQLTTTYLLAMEHLEQRNMIYDKDTGKLIHYDYNSYYPDDKVISKISSYHFDFDKDIFQEYVLETIWENAFKYVKAREKDIETNKTSDDHNVIVRLQEYKEYHDGNLQKMYYLAGYLISKLYEKGYHRCVILKTDNIISINIIV